MRPLLCNINVEGNSLNRAHKQIWQMINILECQFRKMWPGSSRLHSLQTLPILTQLEVISLT